MKIDIEKATILLALGGSRAYGIHLPSSDVDVKGVAIAPKSHYLGFFDKFNQTDESAALSIFIDRIPQPHRAAISGSKLEGTIYEVAKFCDLASQSNPNILDTLHCRDSEVVVTTPLGEKLRENAYLFLSARAKHSFSGYAFAQLKRIKTHRSWLIDPPSHKPTRAEYGLPEHTLIPADQLAAARAAVRKRIDEWEFDLSGLDATLITHVLGQIESHLSEIIEFYKLASIDDLKETAAQKAVGLSDNMIYVLQKEREYEAAQTKFKLYMNWKDKRNPDRAELEAKHGYDTKHGAHLYRLMAMCREIMTTGKVNVYRGDIDADIILSIRQGAWEYDQLIEWAERQDAELTEIYRAKSYPIPHSPDRQKLNELCMELVEAGLHQ